MKMSYMRVTEGQQVGCRQLPEFSTSSLTSLFSARPEYPSPRHSRMVLSFLKLSVTGSTSWVAKIPVSYQTMASKNRARMNNMKKYRSKKKSFHHIFSQTLAVQYYEALTFLYKPKPSNKLLPKQLRIVSIVLYNYMEAKQQHTNTFSRPVLLRATDWLTDWPTAAVFIYKHLLSPHDLLHILRRRCFNRESDNISVRVSSVVCRLWLMISWCAQQTDVTLTFPVQKRVMKMVYNIFIYIY